MQSKTQELTFGAMITAIYGVLLLINRQSAGLFEEIILFVLPIPMAIYSLRYGFRKSLPVFGAMVMISFFFGSLYILFYAVCDIIIGMVLGTRLRSHADMVKTQLIIIVISALASVFSSVVLASLFGINIQSEVLQIQSTMSETFSRMGTDPALFSEMLSVSSLKRLYIIAMILTGILQGFVIFRLSLMILARLRISVPPLRPLGYYFPPRWTGILAFLLTFAYSYTAVTPVSNDLLQNLLQTVGMCAYFYLAAFGWMALVLLVRKYIPRSRLAVMLLPLVLFFLLQPFMQILGLCYIATGLHAWLLEPAEPSF